MNKKKILIIDSDGYFLRMYEQLLETIDFEVITAGDGDRGLYLIQEKRPDLIVSEIKLERQSGLELLEKVKANPQLSEIPFIFLTTSAVRQDIKTALSLGASEYLIKTHHSPTEVIDVIIQLLKKR